MIKYLIDIFTNTNFIALVIGTSICILFVLAFLNVIYYFGERLAKKANLNPIAWPVLFGLGIILLLTLTGVQFQEIIFLDKAFKITLIYLIIAGIAVLATIPKTCFNFSKTCEEELDAKFVISIAYLVTILGIGDIFFSSYKLITAFM